MKQKTISMNPVLFSKIDLLKKSHPNMNSRQIVECLVNNALMKEETPDERKTSMFSRTDKISDVEVGKSYTWKYWSAPVVEIGLFSTGFGEGDAGHGGSCSISFENLGGFSFDVDANRNETFRLTVNGQCEMEILRDFFHQAAKALDEISGECNCHEDRLLNKPLKKND